MNERQKGRGRAGDVLGAAAAAGAVVLCCGLPLLIGTGILATVVAVLEGPVGIALGAVLVVAVATFVLYRTRALSPTDAKRPPGERERDRKEARR